MVLSRRDIKSRIKRGNLSFDPVVPDFAIKQVSVDLRIGRVFTKFKEELPSHIGAIRFTPDIFLESDLWERTTGDSFFLKPRQFVLAKTLEFVCLPNDLMGMVEGRSSWARIGLGIHLTAPKIDPGFKGNITLELSNHGPATIELIAEKDDPCQLILFRVTRALTDSEIYGASATDIFAGQTEPIPSGKSSKRRR